MCQKLGREDWKAQSSQWNCVHAALDFRPRLPFKPNTIHFLVAMTVLPQGALAVCVCGLRAEHGK